MEFNQQFYQNLFKLISSTNKEASVELLKIVKDVRAYYVENGITELWQNPAASSTDTAVLPTSAGEIPLSASGFGTTARRSETTIFPVQSYRKDIVGSDSSDIIQSSQNVISTESSFLPQQQPNKENPAAYSTTLNDSFSRQNDPMKGSINETSFDPDSSIEILGEVGAYDNGDGGTESLRIIQNFEGNEQEDCTVEELCSKSVKANETVGGVFSFGSRPDVIVSYNECQFYEPLDEISSSSTSAKFRKLNDDTPLLLPSAANLQKIPFTMGESEGSSLPAEKSAGPSSPAGNFDSLGGLSCAVCKQLSFTLGNYILECHECHLMYHQKCHDPVIPQNYTNDPRLLWYCSVCSKKQKKVTQKSSSSTTSKVTKEFISLKDKQRQTATIASSLKSTALENKSRSLAIPVQSTASISSSNSLNIQKPLTGVASLAADFLAKHKNKSAPPTTAKIVPASSAANFGTSSTAPPTTGVTFASGGGGLVGLGKLAATQRSSGNAQSSASAPTLSPTLAAKTLNLTGPTSNATTVTGASSSALSTASLSVPLSSGGQVGPSSSTKPAVKKQPALISSTQAAERRIQQMKKRAILKSFIK